MTLSTWSFSPWNLWDVLSSHTLQASLTISNLPMLSKAASQMFHPSDSVSSPTSMLGNTKQDTETVSLYSVPDHTLSI